MATLGSLIVSLEANTAKLASDLGRANTMFESAMNKIGKVCGIARGAVEGLVAAFTVQRIASFAKGLLDAAASLDTLHTQTGLSVAALSALSNEGNRLGINLDTVVGTFDKMQKTAFAAAGGNKAAAAAFAAIGISAGQVAAGLKNPDQLLLLIAQHLQGFADDGNKTALMMTLFGKSGAQMNELLQQLAVNGYSAATTTAAQAKAAEDFNRAMAGMVNSLKATATTIVMDLLPAFDKVKVWLEWVAIFGGTAFLWLVAVPKIATLAVTAVHGLAAAFNALNVSMTMFVTASSITVVAFQVLGAAVAGFLIGKWMYDQFATVRLVGAGMISFFEGMWIEIKYDWQIALSWMTDTLKGWAGSIGSVIAKVPGAIGEFGAKLATVGQGSNGNTAALIAARAAAKLQNQRTYDSFAKDYDNIGLDQVVVTAKKIVAPLPSIQPFNGAVTKLGGSGNDGIIKAMDERLKIITNAMKAEDAATKLANTTLEADYAQGNTSLAQYSTDKNAILQTSFKNTQALYDAEIGLAGTYAKQIQDKLARQIEQQKTVDPTQAARMTAQIAATQAELDQATSKIVVLTDDKAINATKHLEDQVTATENVIAKSQALAKTIIDVDIAYATMNNDTVLANALSTEQQDALTKQALLANGLTEEYKKLLAVEEDRRMRSSQSGLDGMKRAVIDYGKSIQDVATQTEQATTRMLKSMEDALVNFVMTGKLDFKSLITSMISELVRLQIQQSVMPGISSLFGSLLGIGGAGAAATTAGSGFVAGAGGSMFMASGGPVIAGQTYTVGERGPETFVPGASGTIVPNGGANGSASIVYAPTIQIDSRSDRAAVMSDTVKAVRQGQSDLLALLRRYNPGLKI